MDALSLFGLLAVTACRWLTRWKTAATGSFSPSPALEFDVLFMSRLQRMDMTISTPLTARLGIRHPVQLAPRDVIAGARLTAAVSAAGGFGILGGGYGDRAWLEQETAKLASAPDPFSIGFITWSLAKKPELLDIALAARPRAIMLSFGDPKPFAPRIKSSGALLICQVQDELMVRQALEAGADILIAQGTEATARRAPRSISCRRSSISRPAGCRLRPTAERPRPHTAGGGSFC